MDKSFQMYEEIKSEDIQEILSNPPKMLIRWGTSIIFIILFIIVTATWFIHYPDTVQASFKLTSNNTPKLVISKVDGKIVKLLVNDNTEVHKEQNLAYLESTADHKEILLLSNYVNNLSRKIYLKGPGAVQKIKFSHYTHLGELQSQFQTLEEAHIRLKAFLNEGYVDKNKKVLAQEILDSKETALNLQSQLRLNERDIELAEEDFRIQKQLADDKVIAPLDLKREESKALSRKFPYQQTALAIINNKALQRSKYKEILELDKKAEDEKSNFLMALNTFQSLVNAWKQKYIVTSPIDGKIMFISSIQESQTISSRQDLFYIIPPNAKYFGELQIPQQNAGKVKEGQQVYIKFAGYPYQEFGAVKGIISKISTVPYKDSVFLADVELPNGLSTIYNKKISQKVGLIASADILTDDTRLLEKIFFQIRKAWVGKSF